MSSLGKTPKHIKLDEREQVAVLGQYRRRPRSLGGSVDRAGARAPRQEAGWETGEMRHGGR